DQQPHEYSQCPLGLHGVDDLTDEKRLYQRCGRAEDAEHCDDDERALVFKEEGKELAEAGARTILRRAASASAGCRRARHAGPRSRKGTTYDRTSWARFGLHCERAGGDRQELTNSG